MNKLQLTNTTLLSFNCVNPIQSVKALLYSSKDIDFAEMVLVSNKFPNETYKNIRYVNTQKTTYEESSSFFFDELPYIVNTEYCLCIHDDGFVINPHLWTDEFFKYDYIGSPWKPQLGLGNRVGNNGFVLMSNKFIQLTKNIRSTGSHGDWELTNLYYNYFTANGCKYAPISVAMRFSLESKIPECEYNIDNCFGFHGKGDPTRISIHDGEFQQFQEKENLLERISIHKDDTGCGFIKYTI